MINKLFTTKMILTKITFYSEKKILFVKLSGYLIELYVVSYLQIEVAWNIYKCFVFAFLFDG